jgi:methyl-accepting chemotaxis protein
VGRSAIKHFNIATGRPSTPIREAVSAFITTRPNSPRRSGGRGSLAASTRTLILGLAAAAVLIGSLLAFLITRSITGPTSKIVAATGKMATGDFDFTLDIDSRDEVGQLAKGRGSDPGSRAAHDRRCRPADQSAAVDGKLATRADASKHQGDFQKVVEGRQ